MERADYDAFTSELLARVSGHPEAVGLVALGSMAARDYLPDAGSDHDFFVVVRDGHQEPLRASLEWLPRAAQVVLQFRETAHGLKVLYADGHLLEFAVFSPDELALAKVNRYRVLLDRADVERRLAEVAARTAADLDTGRPDDAWLIGQFLTELVVALGRHGRGELLSATQRLQTAAGHLARLLARHATAPEKSLLDGLDPLRRFERVFPGLGTELNEALQGPLPHAVERLLALASRELPNMPARAVSAVRGVASRGVAGAVAPPPAHPAR
ncbi:MAG: hypothetical protein IT384_21730 [Deltaproteobacteria bacterium]|nr:hypothetical protein [Deltaproteobacteria bacterium]